MKRIIAFLALGFLLPVITRAQAPQAITYQAVARDGSGNPLANKSIGVRITIKDGSSSGPAVYQETESAVVTNQFGLFTIQIGTGTASSGTFAGINWATNTKYIQVEFDPTGGTAYLDMGTTQLVSVPYALYAAKSGDDKDSLIINGNQLSIVGGNSVLLPSGSGGGDNWGTQTVVTNSTLTGNGTFASSLGLASQNASNGQVLKWNGVSWAPAADNNTTYTGGTGISISGTTVTNTAPDVPVSITGAGSTTVTGAYPNFTVSSTGGSTYTGGSGITVSGTTITNNAVTDNTTITGNGTATTPLKIAQQGASSGQVLKWNGSSWAPAADNGTTYTAGTGISISGGNVIANTIPQVNLTGTGGTTVTGTYPNLTVNSTAPITYTGGTGISVSGSTITNTQPNQTVVLNGTGATTVTGTYPNFTINSTNTTYTAGSGVTLTGTAFSNNAQTDATLSGNGTATTPLKIAQQGATSGQVLQWNGSAWLPATPASGGGGTLNSAYNFGGPSVGRTITMNDSSVQILVPNGKGTLAQGVGLVATISGGTGDAINAASTIASNGFPAIEGSSNSTNTNASAILGDMTGAGSGIAGQVENTASGHYAVFGNNLGTNSQAIGVYGSSTKTDGSGVWGQNTATATVSTNAAGVTGIANNGDGVYGAGNVGVEGESSDPTNTIGVGTLANIYAQGTITSASGKAFTIDHPLDPANKLLRHYSIESPELLNMYRGNITLDANGEAIVNLPNYFSEINIDFSYNLTPIGDAAPNLHVKNQISGNTFSIAGGKPGLTVSWTVYAERNDLFIRNNPEKKQSEIEKPAELKGKYVVPEVYGQGADKNYYKLHKTKDAAIPATKLNSVQPEIKTDK